MGEKSQVVEGHMTLRQAARAMGLAYNTLHVYVFSGLIPGCFPHRGTRWMIPITSVEAFLRGEISVKGAFRERNRKGNRRKSG
jgi:predicted site-specific integrase-resolvase